MGDLLAWIATLDALDAAGSVDMRNRSSISAYIKKTNALGCIMNAALQVADLDVLKDESIFLCAELGGREDFVLQRVAALAVFRSVESLPTLVKTWYSDDCPRFLRQRLSTFVENVVAPATLERELDRIKSATSFGEMSVKGSVVSREVTATYYQDEVRLVFSFVLFCFCQHDKFRSHYPCFLEVPTKCDDHHAAHFSSAQRGGGLRENEGRGG